MRLKKKGFVIVLMILVLVISSCSSGSRGDPRSSEIEDLNYHTGSQGLVLRFVPGTPPQSVYEGDPLNIMVEYSNKGAYDIYGGQLYISGYDPGFISFYPPYGSFDAKGKSEFNPLGELSKTHEFYADRVRIPQGVDAYSPRFMVTACYKYKTEAFKEVCIDPDPFSVAPREKVCTVHDVSFGTQGAPVAVNLAETTTSRNRVQFKVHVSNVGGGTVIDNRAPITSCHTLLRRSDIDRVSINAKFSDKFLDCEPEIIHMVNGKGISVCTYDGADIGTEAFLTVLNIELLYGYRTSIQTTTNVYDMPGDPR